MSKEMMKMRFLYLTTRGLLLVASLTGLHALVGTAVLDGPVSAFGSA
jgi:hypothetical protein